MNEAQTFHCPTCGAPLDAPQSADTVRCPYCHNTVIVPESISDADQGTGAAYAQPVTVFASASTLDLSEIKNLLQQNQKIEAIKRVRKATGLGLNESKDLVEALERGDDAEAFSRMFAALMPSGETAGGMLEVMTLAQNGQKMEAVKRYHELELPPNPQGYYFEDVSVAPDGRIAAIANSEDIVVFSPGYQTLMTIPEAVSSVSGDSELDSDIDIDGLGNLYVLGHFNDSVFKYTPHGRFTNRFASEGEEEGQLTAAGDLAIDGQGRVYISDFNGVQIFDSSGRFLDRFDLSGYVFGLNFDLQDRLYTVSNEPQVMRLRMAK